MSELHGDRGEGGAGGTVALQLAWDDADLVVAAAANEVHEVVTTHDTPNNAVVHESVVLLQSHARGRAARQRFVCDPSRAVRRCMLPDEVPVHTPVDTLVEGRLKGQDDVVTTELSSVATEAEDSDDLGDVIIFGEHIGKWVCNDGALVERTMQPAVEPQEREVLNEEVAPEGIPTPRQVSTRLPLMAPAVVPGETQQNKVGLGLAVNARDGILTLQL